MLQNAANSPSSFLAALGCRVQLPGFEEAPLAADGASSRAHGASLFSLCGLVIHGELGEELEKGTKKSSSLVDMSFLSRALHLPWKTNRVLEN